MVTLSNKRDKARFVVTGATGLLGRNLMLEIIKKNYQKSPNFTLIILGRSSKSDELELRIKKILQEELFQYLGLENHDENLVDQVMQKNIKCIDLNLKVAEFSFTKADEKILFEEETDILFHVASLTDFRHGKSIEEDLIKTNVNGTRNIVTLAAKMKLKKFSYVSSAYVCGIYSGRVSPDYINQDAIFRNPYEKTKLEAELIVREFANKTGIKCDIFRPSTICGRLMEGKTGSTPKFDVFYGWAIFFIKSKIKISGNFENDINMDLRFSASNSSGLNIVPVDFAAKTMYMVSTSSHDSGSYHLVNRDETPHNFYFFEMLDAIGVKNVKMLDQMPSDKNKLEDFYYKTVGKIFDPYINCPSMYFDTENLNQIYEKFNLKCPKIDKQNFSLLMDYAKEKKFGLNF